MWDEFNLIVLIIIIIIINKQVSKQENKYVESQPTLEY